MSLSFCAIYCTLSIEMVFHDKSSVFICGERKKGIKNVPLAMAAHGIIQGVRDTRR